MRFPLRCRGGRRPPEAELPCRTRLDRVFPALYLVTAIVVIGMGGIGIVEGEAGLAQALPGIAVFLAVWLSRAAVRGRR